MGLFSWLSPAVAMRAFIVANPLIAGLGLFWFLRLERLSRLAATAGGLSLAMLMSTSEIAISMPFAGAMAWTCVALVGAAGYRRATTMVGARRVDRRRRARMVAGRDRPPQPRTRRVHRAGRGLPGRWRRSLDTVQDTGGP